MYVLTTCKPQHSLYYPINHIALAAHQLHSNATAFFILLFSLHLSIYVDGISLVYVCFNQNVAFN